MNTVCDLTDRKCVPCEGGVPTLSREEAEACLLYTSDAADDEYNV